MLCPICQTQTRKIGKNRSGSQRHHCDTCNKNFTDPATRQADKRFLDQRRMITCLRMLLEGNSVRSVERLMHVHRDTIIRAMIEAGEKCKRFMESVVQRIYPTEVQVDEIWGFVGCKEKTRLRNGYGEEVGDCYCFTAIERNTKMILAWHVGKRTTANTYLFADKLAKATAGRFQITTDGFSPYKEVIRRIFPNCDFGTLVKVFGKSREDETRYSPAQVIDVIATPQQGNPDERKICTSHVERCNRQLRMQIRRLTRLTDAHSKKWENHEAALALFFAYYNFCRVHSTLRTTPAVAVGFALRPWTVAELLEQATPA